MTAGITDERVTGGTKVVIAVKHVEITDIFELAGAVRGFAGESPIATGEISRAGRKADDGGGDIITGGQIVNEKVCGRPGLRKIGDGSDDRIVAVRMRQKGIGVGRSRGHFELRSGLNASLMNGPVMRKPADGEEQHESKSDDTNDQRKQWIRPAEARSRGSYAGDLRHIGFKARS